MTRAIGTPTVVECLDPAHGLWVVRAATNGYLIVRDGASLMIDCPCHDAAGALRAAGLPAPELILHTQVQEEHCREWAAFPDADVQVAADAVEVATVSPAFRAACATVWPPSREWSTLGADPYGIAGCVTERSPGQPLRVTGHLQPGQTVAWRGLELAVLALPGSGKRAIGFHWASCGALFSGDLVHAGGKLVNFYDLERCYGGGGGLLEMRASVEKVQSLSLRLLLPSTGPVIADPSRDLELLARWLQRPLGATVRRAGTASAQINYQPLRTFGRYRVVREGICQSTNFGNIVLYVDDAGRGLMVDPCNCVWLSWEESVASMQEDLDAFERELGLKRIEVVLVTHPHGDHMQYGNLLRQRYGSRVLATPDVAAELAFPERFPYPCMLDWYGFPPFRSLQVDATVPYDRPLLWHDTPILPLHTPGHCFAHAAFAIGWRGQKTLCAGDVLQYGQGPIRAGLPFCYNDNGHPDRSPAVAFRRMAAQQPDLVLGGHSYSFTDPDCSILRDFVAAAEELDAQLPAMVPDGDLLRATTPPGFDAVRPSLK